MSVANPGILVRQPLFEPKQVKMAPIVQIGNRLGIETPRNPIRSGKPVDPHCAPE